MAIRQCGLHIIYEAACELRTWTRGLSFFRFFCAGLACMLNTIPYTHTRSNVKTAVVRPEKGSAPHPSPSLTASSEIHDATMACHCNGMPSGNYCRADIHIYTRVSTTILRDQLPTVGVVYVCRLSSLHKPPPILRYKIQPTCPSALQSPNKLSTGIFTYPRCSNGLPKVHQKILPCNGNADR